MPDDKGEAEYEFGDRIIVVNDTEMDGEYEGETGVVVDSFYAEPKVAGFGPPGWKYSIVMDFDLDGEPEEGVEYEMAVSYRGESIEAA